MTPAPSLSRRSISSTTIPASACDATGVGRATSAFLAPDTAVYPIVAAARERWATAHMLRIDPDEQTVQRDGDGYWVRAWVRVDAAGLDEAGAAQIDRYASAFTALPEITRQVFMADLLGDEDFTAIAARLGITTHEVEQHIADALVAISRALDRR